MIRSTKERERRIRNQRICRKNYEEAFNTVRLAEKAYYHEACRKQAIEEARKARLELARRKRMREVDKCEEKRREALIERFLDYREKQSIVKWRRAPEPPLPSDSMVPVLMPQGYEAEEEFYFGNLTK